MHAARGTCRVDPAALATIATLYLAYPTLTTRTARPWLGRVWVRVTYQPRAWLTSSPARLDLAARAPAERDRRVARATPGALRRRRVRHVPPRHRLPDPRRDGQLRAAHLRGRRSLDPKPKPEPKPNPDPDPDPDPDPPRALKKHKEIPNRRVTTHRGVGPQEGASRRQQHRPGAVVRGHVVAGLGLCPPRGGRGYPPPGSGTVLDHHIGGGLGGGGGFGSRSGGGLSRIDRSVGWDPCRSALRCCWH